jgi:hypothetical protein
MRDTSRYLRLPGFKHLGKDHDNVPKSGKQGTLRQNFSDLLGSLNNAQHGARGPITGAHKFNDLNSYACRVYHDANVTVTTSGALVAFNQEDEDDDAMHDRVTDNDRITAKTAGLYLVIGVSRFLATVTSAGHLTMRLRHTISGGATTITIARNGVYTAVGEVATLAVSTIYRFAVNDYLQMRVDNGTSDSQTLTGSTGIAHEYPVMSIHFIGR